MIVHFLFGKMLSILWQICDIMGLVSFVSNGQILKYNLTIWSHCPSPSPSPSRPSPYASPPTLNKTWKTLWKALGLPYRRCCRRRRCRCRRRRCRCRRRRPLSFACRVIQQEMLQKECTSFYDPSSSYSQCNLMVRLYFNIWPFATLKASPIMSQICQSRPSILPNKKWTVKNLLTTCNSFCQSGKISPNLVTLHPPRKFVEEIKARNIFVTRESLPSCCLLRALQIVDRNFYWLFFTVSSTSSCYVVGR